MIKLGNYTISTSPDWIACGFSCDWQKCCVMRDGKINTLICKQCRGSGKRVTSHGSTLTFPCGYCRQLGRVKDFFSMSGSKTTVPKTLDVLDSMIAVRVIVRLVQPSFRFINKGTYKIPCDEVTTYVTHEGDVICGGKKLDEETVKMIFTDEGIDSIKKKLKTYLNKWIKKHAQ